MLKFAKLGLRGIIFLGVAAGAYSSAAAEPSTRATLGDSEVLGVLDIADTNAIRQAKVGVDRGHASAVKNLAQTVQKDDTDERDHCKALAEKLGLKLAFSDLAANLRNDSDKLVFELNRVKPERFDTRFVMSQISVDEDAIKLIDETLLPAAHSNDVRAFVSEARNAVERHLDFAQKTMKSLTAIAS